MKMTHHTKTFISLCAGTLGFLILAGMGRADDIIIDGATYNSPAVFTSNTTATTYATFEDNATVAAATGITLNLAGTNNQAALAITNDNANPSTLTFGTMGNTGTVIIGGTGVALNQTLHPYHITVDHGTLQSSGTDAFANFLGNSSLVTVNAILDMNGTSSNIQLLQGGSSGRIINNSGTQSVLTITAVDPSPVPTMTFNGAIEGNIKLVVNSDYPLILTGNSSYTGGTTIGDLATVQVQDLAANLGSGTITLAGGTLFTKLVAGNEVTTATQDLALTGSSPSTILADDTTYAYYRNLSGGATTTLRLGDDTYHESAIGFSGTSTFTGEIVVASKMEVIAQSDNALGTGDIQIGTGSGAAILYSQSDAAITLDNTFSLHDNFTIGQINGGLGAGMTLSNTITDLGGNYGVTIDSGNITLHGTNDYTGGTTVEGGLFFSKDINLGMAAPVVHLNDGYLIYDGGDQLGSTLVSDAHIDSTTSAGLGAATGSTVVYEQNLNLSTVAFGYTDGTRGWDGEVVLTGNNTIATSIQVNGVIGVGSDLALGTGDYNLYGGTLKTYGSQQIIHVGGNYDQEMGELVINASGAGMGQHDELVVTGTTTLDPGKSGSAVLTVNLESGYRPTAADPLVVVHADGGVTGQFDEVFMNDDSKFITAYSANEVSIYELLFGQTPGLSSNQQTVANNLDQFNAAPGSNVARLIDAISPMAGDAATLAPALDQLSPQSLQVLGHIAFDNATFASQQLNNHLANLRDGLTGFDGSQLTYSDPTLSAPLSQIKGRLLAWNPALTPGLMSDVADSSLSGVKLSVPAETDRWSTFIAGNVILADLNNNMDISSQNYTTGSVTVGADYRLTSHLIVGAQFAYAHTDANLDYSGSEATVDSYSPGLYASYIDGGWYGNASFNYAYNSDTENRNIQIGAINGTNHGAMQGNQYTGNLTGGYEFKRGGWKFGPLASVQYANLGLGSIAESGPAALNIEGQSAQSFRSQLGIEVRYAVKCGSVFLTPHASASWQHEFLDDSRGITSTFNGSGAGSFTVATTSPERDSAFLNIGLNADVTHSLTLFTDYSAQVGQDNFFAQSVQAGLKIGF